MAEAGRWEPYMQRQGQLLPAFVEDVLDPGDPVVFVRDAVEQMDLTAGEERYAVLGEHAYDPGVLLKLWLYAATQGVYSGRELASRRCACAAASSLGERRSGASGTSSRPPAISGGSSRSRARRRSRGRPARYGVAGPAEIVVLRVPRLPRRLRQPRQDGRA
jgi:hypothetical protein